MEKNGKMDKIKFYAECDRLFGQEHPAPVEIKYRGRWGPRKPGAGRFEGYGIVRWFNAATVHISLRHPVGMHMITTPEHALEIIAGLMREDA